MKQPSSFEFTPWKQVTKLRSHKVPKRFLLYCHDTYGLGHLRRTISLAEFFTQQLPEAEILIVTGAPLAHSFTLPPRVDYVKLPSVTKLPSGEYSSRHLAIDFLTVRDLRAALLRVTACAYQPDVFLVDHAPQGMEGEALPTLRYLKDVVPHCLRVLGLRDIIDDGAAVRQVWKQQGIYTTLAYAYDLILVYGSQQFYDLAQEYHLPATVQPALHYCGYVHRSAAQEATKTKEQGEYSSLAEPVARDERVVVVTAGGGGDGFALLSTYLRGLQESGSAHLKSILTLGPLMDGESQQKLHTLAATLPNGSVEIATFVADTVALFRSADVVVAMAGYNTVVELLALQQRMVLVPRLRPRLEQCERALRLSQFGLAQVLLPTDLTPAALLAGVLKALHTPRPQVEQLAAAGIAFHGQRQALQAILRRMDPRSIRLHTDQSWQPQGIDLFDQGELR